MCGIFFYTTNKYIKGHTKRTLEKSFIKIQHRGPTASRIRYYNEGTMMGFHRLAIVDPSAAGMQPFENERYACIINGEIYNYKQIQTDLLKNDPTLVLTSHSDCEVVLHLFKLIVGDNPPTIEHAAELAKRMNGEFAFIIYDTLTNTTFFGVDELRTRPLFIGKQIVFGGINDREITDIGLCSEQKSLVDLFNNVEAIPSGTVGEINIIYGTYKIQTQQYFDFSQICAEYLGTVEEFETARFTLRNLIVNNITLKLCPDRDFGFLLSGGLDSSLICGVAAKILEPHRIRTFTVGFDKNAPDIIAARKVAKHINSIHNEFIFTYEEGIAILPEVIYNNESWDQTTTRASVPMTLAVRAIKKLFPEIAVIYSGELADELFMGYLEWQSAPNPQEARDHVIKRLRDVTYFDGLRADRAICSVGCELRLPFFGKEILNFVLSLPPQLLMPQTNNGIEKFLLRSAFSIQTPDKIGVIPTDVLWRTKHAFSDATSIVGTTSWKEALIQYASTEITNSRFECRRELYPNKTPQTKEDMLYRELFDKYGFEGNTIPYKWLPNWAPNGLTDASATALVGFVESVLLKN